MSSGENEGPAWNKFWLSMDQETESMVSGEGSHRPQSHAMLNPSGERPVSRPGFERGDSVMPHDSASHAGEDDGHSEAAKSSPAAIEDAPFPFKFKAPSGRVHRLQVVASSGISDLIANVTAKLGNEIDSVGGAASVEDGTLASSGYALSYLDNEGDTVSITTDQDLLDAIMLARRSHREKVDLFVHDPNTPPLSATVNPRPDAAKPPTPPESVLKERKIMMQEEASDEEAVEQPSRRERRAPAHAVQKQPEAQTVPGVPNELLLPGAIGVLAVVIVAVFAFGRSSKN